MELSVVIVTYQCRDLVLECLRSLEPQRNEVELEVILLDNASTDGTLAAVTEAFPWVSAEPAGGNLGFATSNNLALTRTTGKYVLLLNPDTVMPAGGLRRCLEEIGRRPDVGMLGCKLVQPTGELDHACKRGFPTVSSSLFYFAGLHRRHPHSPRYAAYVAGHIRADQTSEIDAVNGAFMLCRQSAIDAVGPLDERFWMYGEDLDWCYRFWAAGWKVLYWPEVEVLHVKGGSSTALRSWRSNRAFHEAMWLFHSKHYASGYPALVNGAIKVAISGKLAMSAARSKMLRRKAARTEQQLRTST